MIPLIPLLVLLSVHFIADFVLQTDWQAKNKSKRLDALARHVAAYSLTLAAVSLPLFGPAGLLFALANGALHFGTDYFTSRWSARFARHIVMGLDQLIHQLTLISTLWVFLSM